MQWLEYCWQSSRKLMQESGSVEILTRMNLHAHKQQADVVQGRPGNCRHCFF